MKLKKITPHTAYTAESRDHSKILLMLERRGFNVDAVIAAVDAVNEEFAAKRECNGISVDSFGSFEGEANVLCIHIHTTYTEDSYAEFYGIEK